MRAIISSARRSEFFIVIIARWPDVFSKAETERMPFTSMSNVTSICACPLGIGAHPESSNWPSKRLSRVSFRSPSNTILFTASCPSSAFVYNLLALAGTTVLRGTRTSITPPVVSMPRVRGVTSSSKRSIVFLSRSPDKTPAYRCVAATAPWYGLRLDGAVVTALTWTAAPYATASSGLMLVLGVLPLKKLVSRSRIFGILVDPPTRTTSSTSLREMPASSSTRSTGSMVLRKRSAHRSSNLARVTVSAKSTPGRMDSISTFTAVCEES
mmetsp:Transcript_17424/g.48570  ORF Transcript_17424/g.48570 Transcript_17424/m.48570 type:complete len:269 (-) Transcript_17424:897-1703(-)